MNFIQIQQVVIGVFITDTKERTGPMYELKKYLKSKGYIIYVFDDRYRGNNRVEDWPYVDVVISFFSSGIDFIQVQRYVDMNDSYELNDISKQFLLLDRRAVLSVLDSINVPTAERIVYNTPDLEEKSVYDPIGVYDESTYIDRKITKELELLKIDNKKMFEKTEERTCFSDRLVIGSESIEKPYVEKPVYSENHRINIYYSSKCKDRKNGVCRLFRKIGCKSSEFVAFDSEKACEFYYRNDHRSYIYEKYLNMHKFLDIKAYTVGKNVYAETRKSPVKDGIVIRNKFGKEIREEIELTHEEKEAVRSTSKAFKQFICGMDLLRTEEGKFFIIDVNGWSFVKANPNYYNGKRLKELNKNIKKNVVKKREETDNTERKKDVSFALWLFKEKFEVCSVHTLYRHGSRTPKLKKKLIFTSEELCVYIKNITHSAGRNVSRVSEVKKILNNTKKKENILSLEVLNEITSRCKDVRVKFYPLEDDKVKVVLKWGGNLTKSAKKEIEYEAMKYEGFISSLVGDYIENESDGVPKKMKGAKTTSRKVKIYCNSESRTYDTAKGFMSVLMWNNRVESEITESSFSIQSAETYESSSSQERYCDNSYDLVIKEYETLKSLFIYHCGEFLDQSKEKKLSVLSAESGTCTCPSPGKDNSCVVFCFLNRWCFLFNEYWTITPHIVKTVVPLLLDFINYDSQHSAKFKEKHIIKKFNTSLSGIFPVFYDCAKELSEKRLNTFFENNTYTEVLSFLQSLLKSQTDTLYITKRFTIHCLLKYLLSKQTSDYIYINNELKTKILLEMHDIGFLCSITIVHLKNNSKNAVLIWYSLGISSKHQSTNYAQRKRPLLLIPTNKIFTNAKCMQQKSKCN